MNNPPTVQHLEFSILVPMRIVDVHGSAPASMREVAVSLSTSGWTRAGPQTDEADMRRAHQAYSYFHPVVRRFLFDPARVLQLERHDACSLDIQLNAWEQAQTIELQIKACRLWLFERTEIGLLQLALARPDQNAPALTLDTVQRLLDQVRRLYPPYFDETLTHGNMQTVGGHCPVQVILKAGAAKVSTSDYANTRRYIDERLQWQDLAAAPEQQGRASFTWAAHWQHLLAPLGTLPKDQVRWHAAQIGDDRAALATFVAFSSPDHYRAVDAGNWVRLCFADTPGGDRYPYQEAFLAGHATRLPFEARFCYDRFHYPPAESTDSPSRIMNCGYAFTWAGCASDAHGARDYFMNEGNGAVVTFRHIYTPMAVIAQFQRAALLASSLRISCLVPAAAGKPISEEQTQSAYQNFIAFTQWYWFDEVSPQEQGQDLFAMWRREMRLQELFDEVRQELRDIVDMQNAGQQVELARVALPFAALSVFIAVLSFVTGWFGMNVADIAQLAHPQFCGVTISFVYVLGGIGIVALLVVLFFVRHRFPNWWWKLRQRLSFASRDGA